MPNKAIKITDFISIRTLEKIQDNFSNATGISCVIRDLKGDTITKFSNPSRLWLEVIKNPEIEKETSINLVNILEKCHRTSQIEIYKRYLDTYAFAVPIIINGQITAFFIGGLARLGNPKIETCNAEAQRLHLDLDDFLEMYLELPLVQLNRLQSCANLLKMIGTIISHHNKIIDDSVLINNLNREHSKLNKPITNVSAPVISKDATNNQ